MYIYVYGQVNIDINCQICQLCSLCLRENYNLLAYFPVYIIYACCMVTSFSTILCVN